MAEYLIQDTTLIAIAGAIKAKTGKTSPLTPSAMVAAIRSIPEGGDSGGDSDESEYEVFSATLDGFEPYGTSGTKYSITIPEFIELAVDQTYYVEWDGETYSCKCDSTLNLDTVTQTLLMLGNQSYVISDVADTAEPFLIRSSITLGTTTVYTADADTSHTVRVYYPSSNGKFIHTYNNAGEITRIKGIGVKVIPDDFIKGHKFLTSVDLSECPELETIGSNFCSSCSSLSEVILPASVISMGTAFSSCTHLRSIKFLGTYSQWVSMDRGNDVLTDSDTVLYINGEPVPKNRIVIPDDVTRIGNYAFAYSTYAGDVTIPDNVTSIGNYAFTYCQSITSVVIPDSVTSIGQYAFNRCIKLTNVDIGNNVTSIGNSAFYYCSALTSVIIPDSVTTLGGNVLQYCTALTSVTFGSGITTMGSSVLSYTAKVSSITFKEGMTVIGDSFIGEYGNGIPLTSVVIPASVKKIGKNAFTKATKLTSATFTDPSGWYVSTSSSATSGTTVTLTNTSTAATYLRSNYKTYYWFNGD